MLKNKTYIRRTVYALAFIGSLSLLLWGAFFIYQWQAAAQREANAHPEIAKRISYVTKGTLQPEQPIHIYFSQPVSSGRLQEEARSPLLTVSPDVSGTLRWENERMLVFDPDMPLEPGQTYRVKLDVRSLFPELEAFGLRYYTFSFQVPRQRLESIRHSFMLPNYQNPTDLIYQGVLTFLLPAPLDSVRRSVTALYKGKQVPLHWNRTSEKTFQVTSDIIRNAFDGSLTLIVDDDVLKLEKPVVHEVSALDLTEMQVRSVLTSEEANLSVEVEFTQPLSLRQDIEGLVRVSPDIEVETRISGAKTILTGGFEPGKVYDITVNKGIASHVLTETEETRVFRLTYPDRMPRIVFTESGVILPSASNETIRFRSMNVRRVILEIMRVFPDNIGQFLQTEQLASNADRHSPFEYAYQVGVQKVYRQLNLSYTKNEWAVHELDLSSLIAPNDKGMYLVSLFFERRDADYQTPRTVPVGHNGRDYVREEEGYTYPTRENRIYKPLLRSDIALTYVQGENTGRVYAFNILTATPVPGVAISLRAYQNQVIASKTTGSDGAAEFPGRSLYNVFYIEGEYDGYRTILKPEEMRWDFSQFDVNGTDGYSGGLNAFIFTERGVYQPGDTINLTAILRNQAGSFPANHPVGLKLYNAQNQLVQEMRKTKAVDGIYHFEIPIARGAMTGDWRVEVEAAGRTFFHTVPVETIVPNRLSVSIVPEPAALYPTSNRLLVHLTGNYLFGAPAKELPVRLSAELLPRTITFAGFPNYVFSNPSEELDPYQLVIFSGAFNSEGNADVVWNVPQFSDVPSMLDLRLHAQVTEKNGRIVQETVAVPVYPYAQYIGIKMNGLAADTTDSGRQVTLNVVAVGRAGKMAERTLLNYRIYFNDRVWWWEYDSNRNFRLRFKNDMATEVVAEGQLAINGQPATVNFTPQRDGEYFVEVFNPALPSGHRAGYFFQANRWGYQQTGRERASTLMVYTDKERYAPGEMASLRFSVPRAGRVLGTIIKGNRILSSFQREINGTAREITIPVPITREMMPNVYAAISVIQPHRETTNDRPIRLYGVVPIPVESENTSLSLNVSVPPEIEAGKSFTVEVQTADERPASYVVAVVDEGLLSLTDYTTPDPHGFFYQKEALTASLFDNYDAVIGAFEGKIMKTFRIGGGVDERYRRESITPVDAEQFETVSMYKGPFRTNAQGYGKVTFSMPDYIGAVRVMVIATDKNRYGVADRTIPVRAPLMVLTGMPSSLGPDESLYVPVNVFRSGPEVRGPVKVTLDVSGPLRSVSETSIDMEFGKNSVEERLIFYVKSLNETGTANLTVTAVSAGHRYSVSRELPIVPLSPRLRETEQKIIDAGETASFTIPGTGVKGSNQATLSVTRVGFIPIAHYSACISDAFDNALYPLVSKAFGQLYLPWATPLSPAEREEVDRNINTTIRRLALFQTPSGGFASRPGVGEVSPLGSVYAGHFLAEAKRRGYFVGQNLMTNWIRHEQSMAIRGETSGFIQAYRLFALAKTDQPSIAPLNILRENRYDSLSPIEKWLVAGTYFLIGNHDVAETLAAGISTEIKGADVNATLRSYGLLTEILFLMKSSRLEPVVEETEKLVAAMPDCDGEALGQALYALGRYYESADPGKSGRITGVFHLPDGKKQPFTVTGNLGSFVEVTSGFGKKAGVQLNRTSEVRQARAIMTWSGIPLRPSLREVSEKLRFTMRWYDENGTPINPGTLAQGTTFWLDIEAGRDNNTPPLDDLALIFGIPSGWAVDNIRLSQQTLPVWLQDLQLDGTVYTDIREDKVLWFFDLRGSRQQHLLLHLQAVHAGEFYLPATLFESIVLPGYRAIQPGRSIEVIPSL